MEWILAQLMGRHGFSVTRIYKDKKSRNNKIEPSQYLMIDDLFVIVLKKT